MAVCSQKRYKTQSEKEKLLISSNYSFSQGVFKRLVLQTRKNQGLFGKGLSVYHKILCLSNPREVTIFNSTGCRPASLCHGLLSVMRASVRPSVRVLTFSLNISETTYRILMKFHRNVPAMVLFRIS